MRLITHNMLKSNIKGVETGFPLGIEVVKTEEHELEFNAGVGVGVGVTLMVWVGVLRLFSAGQVRFAVHHGPEEPTLLLSVGCVIYLDGLNA